MKAVNQIYMTGTLTHIWQQCLQSEVLGTQITKSIYILSRQLGVTDTLQLRHIRGQPIRRR